jgi:uncharacterized membrane protein YsdA (DUF1294 family)
MKYAYLIYLAVASLTAFILYVSDKRKAVRGAWRIKESVLLGISFFGGALGGWTAMYLVRHKTRKWYFHAVNFFGVAWQVAVAVYVFL